MGVTVLRFSVGVRKWTTGAYFFSFARRTVSTVSYTTVLSPGKEEKGNSDPRGTCGNI